MLGYIKQNGTHVPITMMMKDNGEVKHAESDTAKFGMVQDGTLVEFPHKDKCLMHYTPLSFINDHDCHKKNIGVGNKNNVWFGSRFFSRSTRSFKCNYDYNGVATKDGERCLKIDYRHGYTYVSYTDKDNPAYRYETNDFSFYIDAQQESEKGFGNDNKDNISYTRFVMGNVETGEPKSLVIGAINGFIYIFIPNDRVWVGNKITELYRSRDTRITQRNKIFVSFRPNGSDKVDYFIILNNKLVKEGQLNRSQLGDKYICNSLGQTYPPKNGVSNMWLFGMTAWKKGLTKEEAFRFIALREGIQKTDLPAQANILAMADRRVHRTGEYKNYNGYSWYYRTKPMDNHGGSVPYIRTKKIVDSTEPTNERYWNKNQGFMYFPKAWSIVEDGVNPGYQGTGNTIVLTKDRNPTPISTFNEITMMVEAEFQDMYRWVALLGLVSTNMNVDGRGLTVRLEVGPDDMYIMGSENMFADKGDYLTDRSTLSKRTNYIITIDSENVKVYIDHNLIRTRPLSEQFKGSPLKALDAWRFVFNFTKVCYRMNGTETVPTSDCKMYAWGLWNKALTEEEIIQLKYYLLTNHK